MMKQIQKIRRIFFTLLLRSRNGNAYQLKTSNIFFQDKKLPLDKGEKNA